MFRRLHWFLTAGFLLALFPLFHFANLPLRIDFAEIGGAYWLGVTARALFCAVLLYVVAFPWSQTGQPALDRVRKGGIWLVLELFVLWLLLVFCGGLAMGSILLIDAIAIAELVMRRREKFSAAVLDIGIPALYFFVGIIVVFSFQHAVAGMRFAGAYDQAFSAIDRRLFHVDVSRLSHFALAHLPHWIVGLLEFAYYSLFAQMGAVIVLCGLLGGRARAIQYVGTLLVGYYLALMIFAAWPTLGPFAICPTHATDYPASLATFAGQQGIVLKAKLLIKHVMIPQTASVHVLDYYIGFPCMHIALPIIAVWSLREWRRMALLMAVFDVLLIFAIVILEWHYLIDMVGGVAVAALAIAIQSRNQAIESVNPVRVEQETAVAV